MKDTIDAILKNEMGLAASVVLIARLHGDASYRTYYRATLDDGSSYIIMQMPEGKASVSEEITNFDGTHEDLPFINVARYLRGHNIPVPTIHRYSEKDRIMILEDLGDDLMSKRVERADAKIQAKWYRKAIDLLVSIQRSTEGDDPGECVALRRSFDAALLNWEFDHFLQYGIGERTGIAMDANDAKTFEEETRAISAEIEGMPYGFTHRDFQSRNLIIQDATLRLIDFQDALLGPAVYDLVALTRDSYVRLSDTTAGELRRYYAELSGRPEEGLLWEYDIITVQRKLKDAGRFVYIDRVKGNPNFLPYIPASLGYVRGALERLPELGRFYELLKKYVPEWK